MDSSKFTSFFSSRLPPTPLKQAGDPTAVKQAAKALLAASHPVIHAGQGVLYAEATDELIQIAEFLQCPVMTTLPGKSAFPHNHPLHIGTAAPLAFGNFKFGHLNAAQD